MTNNELIERYIYAVTRRLPRKQRADIETELNGLISDMLEERCGDIAPTETDVKVVLTELGTPSELAAKYDPDGERMLIGPKYYRTYMYVLKIAAMVSGIVVLVASLIDSLIEGSNVIELIVRMFTDCVTNTLGVFLIVTLVFAVMEYKKVNLDGDDKLSNLPAVPKGKERIKVSDCVTDIVFSAVFLLLFLTLPQYMGIYYSSTAADGGAVSGVVRFFNAEYIRSIWYLFAACFGVEIAGSIYRIIEGRHNLKVAIVTTICNVANTIFSALILLNDKIMNPELDSQLAEMLSADAESAALLDSFSPVISFGIGEAIFAIILFANIISTISAFVRAARYREQ